jgi:isoquinoline 1-oxidoreductase alpha subunit
VHSNTHTLFIEISHNPTKRLTQTVSSDSGESTMNLIINNVVHEFEVDEDTPLLWVLRDTLGMTGTKFGCGVAQCGACSVLIDGEVQRSCSIPAAAVAGREIKTIEGLSADSSHPVQQAWIAEDVPQCGYCQSGQIMAAVALLDANPNPSDDEIDQSMTNICRCGSYSRIRKAIHRVANA